MFNRIKKEVIELTNNKNNVIVSHSTSHNTSGIYMLYIDNFEDNKIIPFYIGQTNNFQKRYEQHIKELLSLNRLNYMWYHFHLVYQHRYDGYFKSCKIFKYMIEHNCTFNNFHMIILQQADLDNLDYLEQQYFKKYLPAFFGFNQINTISESRKISEKNRIQGRKKLSEVDQNRIYEYAIEDGKNFVKYMDYGYSEFNYIYAFFKTTNDKYPTKLNQIIIDLQNTPKYLQFCKESKEIISQQKTKADFLYQNYKNSKNHLNTIKEKNQTLLYDMIDQYFSSNGLKIEEYKKLFIEYILTNNVELLNKILKYVKHYSKDKGVGFESLLEQNKIKTIQTEYNIALNNYSINKTKWDGFECEYFYNNTKNYRYKFLLPNTQNIRYSLTNDYNPFIFPDTAEKNILQINYEFSSERNDYNNYILPELIKIAYRYIGEQVIENEFFISSPLDKFFNDENIFYYEQKNSPFFSKPFNIKISGLDCMISVNIEYKTGLNELILKNKDKETFKNVLNIMSKLINENTQIEIYSKTSGFKSKMEKLLKYQKKNLLTTKLLQAIKRRK